MKQICFSVTLCVTVGGISGANLSLAQSPAFTSNSQLRVQKDRYLAVVRDYADAMLKHGRDTYGPVPSPLIASALDLDSLKIPSVLPTAPEGVRKGDRTVTGSNPMHDENLFRLLYALSDLTGDEDYRMAADDALRYFFSHCQSQVTGLFAWGEHLGWDFRIEGPIKDRDIHEYYRPWVLWEDSFALAPQACDWFAKGVWDHQIADHSTGNFNRHARYDRHAPGKDKEFARHAGFYIATWGAAYRRSKDPAFLHAIEVLMESFERRRKPTGRFPGGNPRSDLSWAIDVWDTASSMPETLGARMRSAARKTDQAYLRKFANGLPRDPKKIWVAGYGDATTAMEAMICHERHQQVLSEEYASRMRDLVVEAARIYLKEDPPTGQTLYPGVFGEVTSLLLAAYRLTKDDEFLRRAEVVADTAVRTFYSKAKIPRASTRHTHYEAITRSDTLALALLEMWSQRAQPERPLLFSWIDR